MKKIVTVAMSAVVLTLAGCAAIKPESPEASKVMIVNNNIVPNLLKTCKFKGQVIGSQGGSLTGAFTSNKNMEQGSMNDLKNKAYELGANYVVMITDRAGSTMGGGLGGSGSGFGGGISGGQTNVTSTGNAYACPASAIGE